MKKLSMAVVGATFITMGFVGVAPTQAALIEFSLTTQTGATGSFTLNTDVSPSSEPALLAPGASAISGISYNNAVSNFSLSAHL